MSFYLLLVFFSSFLCMYGLSHYGVGRYIDFAKQHNWMDYPNQRSSHQAATPVGAGVVPLCLWGVLSLLYSRCVGGIAVYQYVMASMAFLLVIQGIIDDCMTLGALTKWLIFSLVSTVTVLGIGYVETFYIGPVVWYLGWGGLFLTWLALQWSINLFNFMDGSDGIAAVEGIFVFGVGGGLFWQRDAMMLAFSCWSIVFLLLGFLRWNWPPAKVFLGDAGSTTLGYLVSVFALVGHLYTSLSILAWAIIYMWFVTDSSITLFRRLLHRQRCLEAHRQHALHRLLDAGYSKLQALYGLVVINTILCVIVIWVEQQPQARYVLGLSFAVGLCCMAYIIIERINPMTYVCRKKLVLG